MWGRYDDIGSNDATAVPIMATPNKALSGWNEKLLVLGSQGQVCVFNSRGAVPSPLCEPYWQQGSWGQVQRGFGLMAYKGYQGL